VNEFVEECRSEWKRLGVPDPVANEMASDLAADLEEAESEGASPEEVLGSGAFDARSFATAWAAERGVIQRPLPRGHGLTRRSRLAAGIGTFALIAIIGAALVVLASPSAPERLALASPATLPVPQGVWVVRRSADGEIVLPARAGPAASPRILVMPSDDVLQPRFGVLSPDGREIAFALPAHGARIVALGVNDSGVDNRTVGSALLTVGLAGVVLLTMFWLWISRGGWSRRRTRIDHRPSGPAY
jgi:hypothetical protein